MHVTALYKYGRIAQHLRDDTDYTRWEDLSTTANAEVEGSRRTEM